MNCATFLLGFEPLSNPRYSMAKSLQRIIDKVQTRLRERARIRIREPITPENRRVAKKQWQNRPINRAQLHADLCGYPVEVPNRPVPDKCECCHKAPTTKRGLFFDHCHNTGRFLGWCCHGCNTGTGLADNVGRLWLRIAYLKRAKVQITAIPDDQVKWVHPRLSHMQKSTFIGEIPT
jgi:hypothetical protein